MACGRMMACGQMMAWSNVNFSLWPDDDDDDVPDETSAANDAILFRVT